MTAGKSPRSLSVPSSAVAMDAAVRRLSTRDLLWLTAAFGMAFAVCRRAGPELSLSLFLLLYAFGPTLVLGVLLGTRRFGWIHRCCFAATALLVVTVVTMALCGWLWGSQSIVWLMVGALVEWPGQTAVLICLRLIAGPSLR